MSALMADEVEDVEADEEPVEEPVEAAVEPESVLVELTHAEADQITANIGSSTNPVLRDAQHKLLEALGRR